MLIRVAEESFEKGMDAMQENRWKEAMAFFEAAVTLERKFGKGPPQARYLSYFGLCLALSKKQFKEAIRLCKAAAEIEPFNPDLHWNLGRVHLTARNRRPAYSAFLRGLRQEPQHAGLRRELRRMGIRKRRAVSFLDRQNPINVMLGRRRAAS